ncbi:dihydropteroate synthase, partial [bacterium]|nr:dihydropteroate synthase [bacterium]
MMSAPFFCDNISFMNNFYLKKVNEQEISEELERIGFDSSYLGHASDKYKYINIKIFKLTLPQANILKQTALSLGADCAVNKGVLTSQVQFSDCILGGSISQVKQIIEKLKFQQFSMSKLAEEIEKIIIPVKNEPKIVGILNLTSNSFSDGGLYNDFESAVRHLNLMIEDGADIIDIGAESTKPYSEGVCAEKQLEKIEPVLKYISERNIKIPISIDTRSSEVAERVLEYGVSIINDVSGLDFDGNMAKVIVDSGVKVVIQHSQGTPENMQDNPHYDNIIDEIYLSFCEKLKMGIRKENIILDVGIGFGKTKKQNFELIRRIDEFKSLGCEIMLGVSRKSL